MTTIANIFIGPDKLLRPHWRALLYFLLTFLALPYLLNPAVRALFQWTDLPQALAPATTAFGEAENLLIALIATGLFAWYEARRIDSYFMPIGLALSRRT
jgi:hypothetical protein